MTDLELAYIAGIVDGEGYISIITNSYITRYGNPGKQRIMRAGVGMTNPVIPMMLREAYGGTISFRKNGELWKDRYDWNIYSKKALVFLKDILPYLIIKKEQAELAIQFQESKVVGVHLGLYEDIVQEVRQLKIQELNKRGKTA